MTQILELKLSRIKIWGTGKQDAAQEDNRKQKALCKAILSASLSHVNFI